MFQISNPETAVIVLATLLGVTSAVLIGLAAPLWREWKMCAEKVKKEVTHYSEKRGMRRRDFIPLSRAEDQAWLVKKKFWWRFGPGTVLAVITTALLAVRFG